MSLKLLLDALPAIATQPLAVLAYIVLVVGWVVLQIRRQRSNVFLETLESVNKKDRPEFCLKAGYSYDELARLTRKDQMKVITRRYLLLAYLATLVAIVLFALAITQHALSDQYVEEIKEQIQKTSDDQQRLFFKIDQLSTELIDRIEGLASILPTGKENSDDLEEKLIQYKTELDTIRKQLVGKPSTISRWLAFGLMTLFSSTASTGTRRCVPARQYARR